jgi:hypothetical protein
MASNLWTKLKVANTPQLWPFFTQSAIINLPTFVLTTATHHSKIKYHGYKHAKTDRL